MNDVSALRDAIIKLKSEKIELGVKWIYNIWKNTYLKREARGP